MRVVLLGSGAREHALAYALRRDPAVAELVAAPGNPGIRELAEVTSVDVTDPAAVVRLARSRHADLVVVGPEAPLVAGVSDALQSAGIPCFGPSAAAARIEASKSFAKEVMAAAGVRTAAAAVFEHKAAAFGHLETINPPYVVKYDGLAAGKGVTVTADLDEAKAAVAAALARPDDRVVCEEYLAGPEVSLFAITDGETARPLLPAQDYKRLGDADTGPNTGGMGAYAPLPWAPPDLAAQVCSDVVEPTIAELADRGSPFRGLLYAGLALTADGPAVVEFNARFGDPETQSVLALLQSPISAVLHAAATGTLATAPELRWITDAAVTVVVAAAGYPARPRTGDPIDGVAGAAAVPGVLVQHAGTALTDGQLVSAGGRVLAITAVAPDLAAARASAYEAVDCIRLDGAQVRQDIALAAACGQVSLPAAGVAS